MITLASQSQLLINTCIYLFICLFVYLFICLFVCICLFVYLFICLFVYLFICLFLCLLLYKSTNNKQQTTNNNKQQTTTNNKQQLYAYKISSEQYEKAKQRNDTIFYKSIHLILLVVAQQIQFWHYALWCWFLAEGGLSWVWISFFLSSFSFYFFLSVGFYTFFPLYYLI